DPYTDLQKAIGDMNVVGAIDPTAKHPFVAACPSIGVFMEDYLITENITNEWSKGKQTSAHTSSGLEDSKEEGTTKSTAVDLELGLGNEKNKQGKITDGLTGSASVSQTITTKKSSSQTTIASTSATSADRESQQKSFNTAKGGYLTGKVRYKNTGTAPIEQLAPTMNFSLWENNKWSSTPISTIKANKNTTANIVGPKHSYPPGDLPLSITPGDDYNSELNALSKAQVDSILSGSPISLDVPQISGTFTGAGGKGLPDKGKQYQWSEYMPQIEGNAARLVLELPNETLERWVAAPDENSPVRLTIGEAIDAAFGTTKYPDGSLSYAGYSLNRSDVDLFFDPSTERILKEELTKLKTQKDVTIYDVKLKKEMVLLIKPVLDVKPGLYSNFLHIENHSGESWFYSVVGGKDKTEVARGIIPSGETRNTGYICDDTSEKLYISIGKQAEEEVKVIFNDTVSKLKTIQGET
ncbi:hypothetical protein ACLBXI_30050, partial [Bacillus cereus]